MVHIALCEDNAEDMDRLCLLVDDYAQSHKDLSFDIKKFSNSLDLLKELRCGASFSLYILDIIMPQTNGISLGRMIRDHQKQATIIFTSSSKDYALDAYGILAQRYLLKPIDKAQLFEALDYGFLSSQSKQDKIFPLKTADGIVSVPYNNIVYAECSSRAIHLCCANGTKLDSVFIRRNFETEIGSLLSSSFFIQTHKSFAINMEHVEQYRVDSFLLDNGAAIPVARKRQAEVKRNYLKFLAEYGQ